MILHGCNSSGLASGLKIPVMSSCHNRVQKSQLSLTTVGGSDDLVLIHHGAATNVRPETLRDTCQGNSCLGASSPPMILPSVSVTSFPWGLARLRAHRESSTRHFMMSSPM